MKWLIIDAHFLCHRAFHSVGPLAYGDQPTGVIFGFLMELLHLQSRFEPDLVVFCFDYGPSKRREVYPDYKRGRRERIEVMAQDERARRDDLDDQIDLLRRKVLRKIGFQNVLFQSGYEGDDMMAKVLEQLPPHSEAVMVTSDYDMFQCVADHVTLYSPQAKKHYTVAGFRKTWGLEPGLWAKVKAIGGCKSDDVQGVPGVAEKTAIKYLTGQMNPKTATYAKIKAAKKQIKHNMRVVGLPFKGAECPPVAPDKDNGTRWDRTVKGLGMDSLVGQYGAGTRKRARKGGVRG